MDHDARGHGSYRLQRTVVVAVIAVRVVQSTANEVVGVLAVRDRLVPAVGTVLMGRVVARRGLGVVVRVLGVDRDGMLVDVVSVGMVEMPVVQVIDVTAVAYGGVAAVGAMDVVVPGVDVVLAHDGKIRPAAEPAKAVHTRIVLGRSSNLGRV
jgi:hypothetical protein